MSDDIESWISRNPPPDLEGMVERWGGWDKIPDEAWRRFSEDMVRWQDARRDRWLK